MVQLIEMVKETLHHRRGLLKPEYGTRSHTLFLFDGV
jgi:hypothetical protein